MHQLKPLATMVNLFWISWPTIPIAVMAAIEIRAATTAYSVDEAPRRLLTRLRMTDGRSASIGHSPRASQKAIGLGRPNAPGIKPSGVADTGNAQRVTLVGNAASRPKEMGGPLPDRPFRDQDGLDQVMVLATLLITFETLVPTVLNAVIAATAISEYSMAVAPTSFFIRRRKMDSIGMTPKKMAAFFS